MKFLLLIDLIFLIFNLVEVFMVIFSPRLFLPSLLIQYLFSYLNFSDGRSAEQKRQMSWTQALREVVKSCYRFHGCDRMLAPFPADSDRNVAPPPGLQPFPGRFSYLNALNTHDTLVSARFPRRKLGNRFFFNPNWRGGGRCFDFHLLMNFSFRR